jgi:hypothetical protein
MTPLTARFGGSDQMAEQTRAHGGALSPLRRRRVTRGSVRGYDNSPAPEDLPSGKCLAREAKGLPEPHTRSAQNHSFPKKKLLAMCSNRR